MKKSKSDLGSTERFGYEWGTYQKIIPEYEQQFLKWVYPLVKSDFKGKKVLDAGAGIGRNSYWPLKYGAKKVVSFDYNKETVSVARKNLSQFKNAEVFYNSIYEIPYENEFDISFSIGVIHHLEKPLEAIKNLVKATKPEGLILVWVYGYEGNEWIVKYVNPLRKITSRLPLFVTHTLASVLSVPLYLYLKLFKQKSKYLLQLSRFRFWHIRSIVFDQLIPKIANYWKKDQALKLFSKEDVKDIAAYRVNDISWTVIARKK